MRQFAFSLLAASSILLAPVVATASTLQSGIWYLFYFNYGDGSPAPLQAPPGAFGGLESAPDGPWTFTLLSAGSIEFVDLGFPGDRFEIFDFGVSIGLTSVPILSETDGYTGCNFDPECATSPSGAGETASFSTGVFALLEGTYSITGTVSQLETEFTSGFGAFRLRGDILQPAPIPLPAALPLLMGGLALLGAVGRRRRVGRLQ